LPSQPSVAQAMPDRPPVDLTRVPAQPWGLLNEFQAAALIGVPVKRLRKHRMLGLGPEFFKIGATVRYSLDSLERYVSTLPRGGNGVTTAALKNRARAERKSGPGSLWTGSAT
jgi:hypothetical protein